MGSCLPALPAIPAVPKGQPGDDAGRIPVHLFLGIPTPPARAHDWTRVPHSVCVFRCEALDESHAAEALIAPVRPGRDARRYGLVDGSERIGGPAECQS